MPLELVTLRCLKDNYAYLLHSDAGTVLIDAPEAMPVLTELEARGWGLDAILLTHHHDDHIEAVPEIVAATGAGSSGPPPMRIACRRWTSASRPESRWRFWANPST